MGQEIGGRVRELIAANRPDLSQAALAERLRMTPDAFSRSLNGQRNFSAAELARVAEELHTSMHWLATGVEDPFAVKVAARHAYNPESRSFEAEDWDAQAALRDVALAYQQVGALAPPQSAGQQVPRSAAAARRQFEEAAGDGFVREFASAVEEVYGIGVTRIAGVERGYSFEAVSRRGIVVAETPNWFHQNWSIAHELGHLAFGHMADLRVGRAPSPGEETLAHSYAAELLLPRSQLESMDWKTVHASGVAQFVWDAGVSTAALSNRLKYLGLTVSSRVATLLQMTTQRLLRGHWQHTERGDAITRRMEDAATRRFPSWLVTSHWSAVAEGRLHARTLAWMLDGDEADITRELAPSSDGLTVDDDWLASSLGVDLDVRG